MIFFLIVVLVGAVALAALISRISDIMDINKHIKIMKRLCYMYGVDMRLFGEYQKHLCEDIYLPNLPPRHQRLEKEIRDKWNQYQYSSHDQSCRKVENIDEDFDMDLALRDFRIYLPKSLVCKIKEFTLSSCKTERERYLISMLEKTPKSTNTRKSKVKPNPTKTKSDKKISNTKRTNKESNNESNNE